MQQVIRAKRIVLSTFGSLGDINPYIGIALELRARGYHPVIATTEAYREKVEALAIGFHPVRPVLPSYDKPEEVSKFCVDDARKRMIFVRTPLASVAVKRFSPLTQGIFTVSRLDQTVHQGII